MHSSNVCHGSNRPLLSGEELSKYRNPINTSLPSRGGQKESDPDHSWLQAHKLDYYYSDLSDLLTEERVERVGCVVIGEWNPTKDLVEFDKELGKFWVHMGFADCGRKWLYPEEAVYLMETKVLEVYYCDLPVSIQEAYSTFFGTTTSLQEYQVYAHLRRLGYILKHYEASRRDEQSDDVNTDSDNQVIINKLVRELTAAADIVPDIPDSHKLPKFTIPHCNFSDIDVPNISGMTSLHLSSPDTRYIPDSIQLTSSSYTIDRDKIATDSQTKRKKRRDDTEFPDLHYSYPNDTLKQATNWSEYKNLLCELKNIAISEGPGAHLWSGEVTPLMSSTCATSHQQIMKSLDIFKKPDYTHVQSDGRFKISYDVYLPNSQFKKSQPGEPNHRVCITRLHDPPPTLHDLACIHSNTSTTPVIWAVVGDNGDISFMSMSPVDVCVDDRTK